METGSKYSVYVPKSMSVRESQAQGRSYQKHTYSERDGLSCSFPATPIDLHVIYQKHTLVQYYHR